MIGDLTIRYKMGMDVEFQGVSVVSSGAVEASYVLSERICS